MNGHKIFILMIKVTFMIKEVSLKMIHTQFSVKIYNRPKNYPFVIIKKKRRCLRELLKSWCCITNDAVMDFLIKIKANEKIFAYDRVK